MEQKSHLRLIFKLHTKMLKNADWNLTLPLEEAIRTCPDTVVSIGDSQLLRFIDELNGIEDMTVIVKAKQCEIRFVKKQPTSAESKKRIRKLYKELYDLQFQKDYLCVVMDRKSDYDRANKGFTVNGIKYRRFLGTNGGIKNSTIVYVNEKLYPELKRRLDNGRKMNVPLVPAKLEAYQALVCSGSTPLPEPNGIIVVKDCITTFREDVIVIDDSCDGEPKLTHVKDYLIEHNDSDGYGLMLPSYSRRINEYFGGDPGETLSGFNSRWAFTKGMVFTFDYLEFAENVAGSYEITDVWGHKRDIRDAEVILTESMLKLWNCYDSWEDYYGNCKENHYVFAASKVTPKELESVRTTNYQFIQGLDFSDDDLHELCQPTIDEIKGALGLDYKKCLAFLAGFGLNEKNIKYTPNDYVKALMIDQRMINDPFVRRNLYSMMRKKINNAKKGSVKVDANYAIILGDPYALCQSMFGLEVTGLLSAGEVYHKYWIDKGASEIVCFRAPMLFKNNSRKLKLCNRDGCAHWYQYIDTGVVLNAWDSTREAASGADADGDTFMCSDSRVLLANTKHEPPLICIQRKADKKIVTEDDIVVANKLAFSDDIGIVTNRATGMLEVRAGYDIDSVEYKELTYRVQATQNYQQNCIDKTKGAISKPMPVYWYDKREKALPDDERKELNRRIAATKKPKFMIYVYENEKRKYREFVKSTNDRCLIQFGKTIDELRNQSEKTDAEKEFLYWYNELCPVGVNPCTVNRICDYFESVFSRGEIKEIYEPFDYSILKSDAKPSKETYDKVVGIYNQYMKRVKNYLFRVSKEHISKDDIEVMRSQMDSDFIMMCSRVCPNEEELCNIVLDICYTTEKSKRFAWATCGEQIVNNLLKQNNGRIRFPMLTDGSGEFEFCGKQFNMMEITVGLDDE